MLATVTNQGKAKNKNKGNLRHFGFWMGQNVLAFSQCEDKA
jgi:hypothetical protein